MGRPRKHAPNAFADALASEPPPPCTYRDGSPRCAQYALCARESMACGLFARYVRKAARELTPRTPSDSNPLDTSVPSRGWYALVFDADGAPTYASGS